LGYTTIFLPSIPGHDGDRIAAIWIPIWMIFVRQKKGISHNPLEKMWVRDYNVACHTMMKAVLANLV
jgi:acetylornithine deacetylase/succinyl-diaminopimelate desuccinylase-like protein